MVLANLEVNGRQIDCVVATANVVSVIEVKSSELPIRGNINGNWARLSASGEWMDYINAYQQVVGAKNRLRDAMQALKPVGAFHPDGYVVFTSPIPEGSVVTARQFQRAGHDGRKFFRSDQDRRHLAVVARRLGGFRAKARAYGNDTGPSRCQR